MTTAHPISRQHTDLARNTPRPATLPIIQAQLLHPLSYQQVQGSASEPACCKSHDVRKLPLRRSTIHSQTRASSPRSLYTQYGDTKTGGAAETLRAWFVPARSRRSSARGPALLPREPSATPARSYPAACIARLQLRRSGRGRRGRRLVIVHMSNTLYHEARTADRRVRAAARSLLSKMPPLSAVSGA